VKDCVKYLGIYISKNLIIRQQLNFNNKIKLVKKGFIHFKQVYPDLFFLLCLYLFKILLVKKLIDYWLIFVGKISTTILKKKFW